MMVSDKNFVEEWKDIKGYEGKYQVSNFGRVKSLWFEHNTFNGIKKIQKEKILSQREDNLGYVSYGLFKNGKPKRVRAHKLVVEAFIGSIPKGLVVNHINGIKSDNRVENLEICTYSHNTKEAFRLGIIKYGFGELSHRAKIINQLDLENNVINTFHGCYEAERETKISSASIYRCLKGKQKQAQGYMWEYAKEA